MKGRILKGVGGFYTVAPEDGLDYITLTPAGRLRQEFAPLPGDWVTFDHMEDGGAFYEILPRKNVLQRPRVANVDLLLAIVSARQPAPDLLLLDQLCVSAVRQEMEVIAILNKCDLASAKTRAAFLREYHLFSPICVSSRTGEGVAELRAGLRGVVCFAGQSGVGKSSIAALVTRRALETGMVSQKTGRGKHTTRHAELIPAGTAYLVDTPGFGLMELPLEEPCNLREWMPEFAPYLGQCRFQSCLHRGEPGCVIRAAVEREDISPARYQRYLTLLEEMNERWNNRYD